MPNTNPYGTIAELKARTDKRRADDDTVLTALILGASRAIDRVTNRDDGFISADPAEARQFPGSGLGVQRIDECTDVTLVEVKSVTDTAADYVAWAPTDWFLFSGDKRRPQVNNPPYDQLMAQLSGTKAIFTNGEVGGRSYQDGLFPNTTLRSRLNYNPRAARSYMTVRVTAKWGYADTVPETIAEATLMLAARWHKRFESAMSDVLADGELGQLLYRQVIDPDIKFLLYNGRYIRPTTGRR